MAAEDPSRVRIRNTAVWEEALSSHPRPPGRIIGATGGEACLNLASGGLQDGGEGEVEVEVKMRVKVRVKGGGEGEGWR